MTTTAQAILVAAYNRSGRTRNQQIATESTELLEVIKRSVRTTFAIAARVNPFYFGKSLPVAFASGGWTWPSDMELLYQLEAGGVECVIVPVDQKDCEPSKPAVYPMGRKLYSAGNALDPVSGNLTFIYSRRPVDPADLNAVIDADFPDAHIDVMIADLARYLAIKDGRAEDIAAFQSEWESHVRLFLAHIEHATASIERRKFGQVRRFNLDTLIPNSSGGGS